MAKANAQEIAAKVSKLVGGRCGGKGESYQGIGDNAATVDKAIHEVTEYFMQVSV